MGRRFYREPVSLLALGAVIAAQGSNALAQDPAQPDAEASATPAEELQPASSTPPESINPAREVTDTIVVTGSRIPRRNLTAVSPVTVVDKEEIVFQGVQTVEELLNRLPQIAPSQGLFMSNNATGTADVDLRNLGASRTLVLINGRRLAPGDPFYPNPDTNLIPPTLIQRVEVLTGGATSVYGSDAVSGVVNFILDTQLDGLRVDGQASVYQHNNRDDSGIGEALDQRGFIRPKGNTVDAGRQSVNVAYGNSFFDERAHLTIYGGYFKTSELRQDKRDYSACAVDLRDDYETLVCTGSPVSYPGNFFTNFGPLTLGEGRTFRFGATPFNFSPWNFYQRSGRRWTGGGFADVEISDAFTPYVELMYLNDRTLAQIAPSGNFQNTQDINCDSPLLSEQQRDFVCFDGNFVGQDVLPIGDDDFVIVGEPTPFIDPVTGATYFRGNLAVGRRAVETGGRQADIRHKNLRLVGGFKGDPIRGISYDASYLYERAKADTRQLNYFSNSRMTRALDVITDPSSGQPVCRSVLTGEDPNCVPWDIFEIGAVTPEATAYLSIPATARGVVKEQVANINATIDLGEWDIRSPWAHEAPSFNIGAEYRKDQIDYVPDEISQSGDLGGAPSNPEIHGSTKVKELFAEAQIPIVTDGLVKRLAFELGYRLSWYSASDSDFSTDSYKIALDLTAVTGVRLRASQQRAVRAPNIVELFTPSIEDFFLDDPCAGFSPKATVAQCALTGLSPAQYGQVIPIPEESGIADYNAIYAGNLDLQPEIAKTRTAGLVLEPAFLHGLTATIDWWEIRLEDAVAYVPGDTIVANCMGTEDPTFCERIHRDANGSLWLSPEGFIDTRLFNIGSLELQGVDIGINYRRDLGRFGSANLEFNGSYLHEYIVDNGGLSESFDCAGRYGFDCFNPIPDWRHTARLTWEGRQGISVSLNWRYTAELKYRPFPDEVPLVPLKVPDQSFFDLAAVFRVEPDYTLRLGVNNIFDREPPLTIPCVGPCNGNTFPQWYDPLGRNFFAGFTVNF